MSVNYLAPVTDQKKPAVWAATPREAGWIVPNGGCIPRETAKCVLIVLKNSTTNMSFLQCGPFQYIPVEKIAPPAILSMSIPKKTRVKIGNAAPNWLQAPALPLASLRTQTRIRSPASASVVRVGVSAGRNGPCRSSHGSVATALWSAWCLHPAHLTIENAMGQTLADRFNICWSYALTCGLISNLTYVWYIYCTVLTSEQKRRRVTDMKTLENLESVTWPYRHRM